MTIEAQNIAQLRADLDKVRSRHGHWHAGLRVRNRINALFKAFEDEGVEASHEVMIVQAALPNSTRQEPLLINICLVQDQIMMMEVDPKVDLRFGIWLASVEDPWCLSNLAHKLAWDSGMSVNEDAGRAPTVEEAECFKQLRAAYRNMVQSCILRQSVPTANTASKAPRL
jgi:hypothetical protein